MQGPSFECIDGHTAGNPVRLFLSGAPELSGATMSERRLAFLAHHDHLRTGLMYEPRGHDMMSGGFLYPSSHPDADVGILFVETSGCLPMCGHGTIGLVTFALQFGHLRPRTPGRLKIEVPAGLIDVEYEEDDGRIVSVKIRNVPSYLAAEGIEIEVPGFGPLRVDVAYGGNFYAIVEPQGPYAGLDALGAARIVELSRTVRALMREAIEPVHPLDPSIRGVSHVMWTDRPMHAGSHARNAVFYGERAIDRSPCGTGTSARMAQLFARGELQVGARFVHESYIGSVFVGGIEATTTLGDRAAIGPAIVPTIQGRAWPTGVNRIFLDPADPFVDGFVVL